MYGELLSYIRKTSEEASETVRLLHEETMFKKKELKEYSVLFESIEQGLDHAYHELRSLIENIYKIEDTFNRVLLNEEFIREATEKCVDHLAKLYKEFEIDEDEYKKLIENLEVLLRTRIKELFKRIIIIRNKLGVEPPYPGKSLDQVIEDVIRTIIQRRKDPPKRERQEYGVLDLSGKQLIQEELEKFVKKHARGIIIIGQDIKEKVLQALSSFENKIYYNTYSDNLAQKLILTFQWKH